ncbi:MAG: FG-GAP repeat domain-containing protein [Thermoguttaceae bacterium]
MKRRIFWQVLAVVVAATSLAMVAYAKEPKYNKIVVSTKFHGEGAFYGDFNKDGILDVVVGHYWYEGPDFKKSHQIYGGEDAQDFDPKGYSNCFGMFTDDYNGDGWIDVLVCPHPGTTGYWYENPQNKEGIWKKHLATVELGNESQMYADVNSDGRKEILFNRDKFLGFAAFDPKNADEPWTFTAISPSDDKYQRYTHGVGYGDVNGDGRLDMLDKDGWWENPGSAGTLPWKFHPAPLGDAAAHILVYDFDGDGLNDIFTSTHCHLYGLAWFKQVRKDGVISFEKQVIIPSEPSADFTPKVSQLHALLLIDMNGDNIKDVVTGKRFWAHGPEGDVEPNAPAILMWWETKRDNKGGVTFVPHIIDEDSGVGTQVSATDLNGDGVPDVIVGNKKGAFVFLSQP